MKMDIDVTELTAYELQRILANYPRGRLVVKHDRIFWDSGMLEPVPSPNGAAPQFNQQQPPRQPQRAPTIGERFERMTDALGSMVC